MNFVLAINTNKFSQGNLLFIYLFANIHENNFLSPRLLALFQFRDGSLREPF